MENTLNGASHFSSGQKKFRQNGSEIQLDEREIIQVEKGRGVQIQALNGILWITQKGDPEDYVLKPGEQFSANRDGSIVIQGMHAARFRMVQ